MKQTEERGWQQELSTLMGKMEAIRQQGASIPEKFGMSQEEFEQYSNNPSNFSPEAWSKIEEVRGVIKKFRDDMQAIFDKSELVSTLTKSQKNQPKRQWIAVK